MQLIVHHYSSRLDGKDVAAEITNAVQSSFAYRRTCADQVT